MPEAFHTATDELAFADDWAGTPGIHLKLLMADVEGTRFAVRIRFAPGILLPPHKHTGEVHAFTLTGEWSYLEHPANPPSRAGSYLFEPPGSTHTLKVAEHKANLCRKRCRSAAPCATARCPADATTLLIAQRDREQHSS